MSQRPKTVGLLHVGEMGAAVASVLRSRGIRVVTTLRWRGNETARRAVQVGVVTLGALQDVVRESDVVISLVLPDAAAEVANSYCFHAKQAPAGAVYVDANSIGPSTVRAIADRFAATPVSFVDGAINGLAMNLTTTGTIFLSGDRASAVADLFGTACRMRVLGSEVGQASAMKMLLGGVSKGVCALFAELATLADRQGMLKPMLEATGEIYPGIAALVDRMLPTYAQHADRRVTEMLELEQTARAEGIDPTVIEAIRDAHEALAAEQLQPCDDVAALVRQLNKAEVAS